MGNKPLRSTVLYNASLMTAICGIVSLFFTMPTLCRWIYAISGVACGMYVINRRHTDLFFEDYKRIVLVGVSMSLVALIQLLLWG